MGIRGYLVWLLRGYYICHYEGRDSYPSGMGVRTLQEIPTNLDDVEPWARRQRLWAEGIIKCFKAGKSRDDDEWAVWHECPKNDIFIEWIYVIDLNDYIFHVNGIPLFNLRKIPVDAGAILVLAEEEEFHRDIVRLYEHTLPPNRWDSELERLALPADAETVQEYAALGAGTVEHIVPPLLRTKTTAVRRRFAEMFIAHMCWTNYFVQAAYDLYIDHEYYPGPLTRKAYQLLDFLLRVTLRPPTAATSTHIYAHVSSSGWYSRRADVFRQVWNSLGEYNRVLPNDGKWTTRTCWIRANVCAHFQAYLTIESNVRAGVVRLVGDITAHAPTEGIVYGVLISVAHCVLVSYDAKTRAVSHTAAMPLLPPWETQGWVPSTPGMIALTDLCQHLDDEADGHPDLRAPKTVEGGRVPFDVLAHIAGAITDSGTLLCFAAASAVCKQAAKPRLMLPKLNGAILERVRFDRPTRREHDRRQVYCADGEVASLTKMWVPGGSHGTIEDILQLFAPKHV